MVTAVETTKRAELPLQVPVVRTMSVATPLIILWYPDRMKCFATQTGLTSTTPLAEAGANHASLVVFPSAGSFLLPVIQMET